MHGKHMAGIALALLLVVTGSGCASLAPPPTPPPATPVPTAVPTVAATPTPALAAGGNREAAALWVSQKPEGFTGGTTTVRIAVEPNPSREPRVGFFEDKAGGSGPTLRAAGWMAVIMSGLLLNTNPTDYRYSYEVSGYADGPSGGALMTVATLAALLGHELKPDATMTGTIGPDGTIGPVGGIPHKIDGAAEAKKKLVLIPAGQREAEDFNAKKKVDTVAYGRQRGVEVREVGDIYEAYELLTGRPLPRPAARQAGVLALPDATAERARTRTTGWLERHREFRQKYEQLPEATRVDYTNRLLAEAMTAAEAAEEHARQGRVSAAYGQAETASVYAVAAYHGARAADGYLNGGFSSVKRQVDSLKPTLKIDGLLERLNGKTPATLGDVIALADAYGNLGLALGLIEMGDEMLTGASDSAPEGALRAVVATLLYVYADHATQVAENALALGIVEGKTAAPEPEKVRRLAELFQSAAEANFNYFNNVILGEQERAVGWFAMFDLDYVMAYASLNATEPMGKKTRGEKASTYAGLGGALQSYVLSSLLLTKYYSLDIELDDDGKITSVENADALKRMLDLGEKRATEIVGSARDAGLDPTLPVLSLERGQAGRAGDVEQQLDALGHFWSAALRGQMITLLSDQASLLPK